MLKDKRDSRFQIVIPMSGFGERFRRAGYLVPKPLIEIEGKPIIAHVIDMFPGETDFLFICNQEHLDEPRFRMRETLQELLPLGKIVGIPAHKLGPVHAVRLVEHLIDENRPVVVNYCDFTCYWNWNDFKDSVLTKGSDGAIPAYKGFHPHSLGTTNYAYMREKNGWVLDIQEKQPYTNNRMSEYASSGTYYFRTGQLMKKAFNDQVDENLSINGEYYVSLAYKPLLREGSKISVYELEHFMQWGTPDDVAEYQMWSQSFRNQLIKKATIAPLGTVLVPMAGLGKRFSDEGYSLAKPLLRVSGKPMVVRAAEAGPPAKNYCFVVRSDMPQYEDICKKLQKSFPSVTIKVIKRVTEGQACTADLGLKALSEKGPIDSPITICACDNGMIYDRKVFEKTVDDADYDLIVWTKTGYTNAIRKPEMYGWVLTDKNDQVQGVSVKKTPNDPSSTPVVIGTFTFRTHEIFENCYTALMERDGRVNGEFYLDSLITDALNLGLRCKIFEVDSFLCWGTPNDLRTFEYWQSCFHKWPSHPYRLELDPEIEPKVAVHLTKKYNQWERKKELVKTVGELVRFGLIGMTTVLLDFLIYQFLKLTLQVPIAKGLGFVCGTIFSYFANRFFTFQNQATKGNWWRFLVVYAVGLGINVGVNSLTLSLIGSETSGALLAFLCATASSTAINFAGMKFFAFNGVRNDISRHSLLQRSQGSS